MKKVFQSLKNGKKRIVTSLISIFFLGLFVSVIYIFVPNNQTKANPGWLTSWTYRKPITINNTSNSNTLTNYQVLVTVDTATLISQGKLQSDCDDLRFTDSDETTLLNYWIEDGSCNSNKTYIWIKIPSIPASSNKTIYMYYGNSSATAGSNGSNVFIFFDDFNDGSFNTGKWTRSTAGSITESSGILDMTRNCIDACGANGVWVSSITYNLPSNNFRVIQKSYISCSNSSGYSACSYSFPTLGFANTGDLSFLMYSRDNYSGDQCYYTNRNKVFLCHNAPSGPCTASLPIWVDKWQREIISEYGPSSTMIYLRDDGTTVESMTDTVTFATSTSQISYGPTGWWYYHTIKLDYVGIAQYASPEPTTTVGNEQTQQQQPITLTYRKPITINNTSNSNTLTNYQVLITVDTATLISQGKLQSDCDDLRFTDNSTSYNTADWTNNYPYWLESGCNTTSTKIWVKVDSIPASSNKTIYMYYGNASASSGSDGNSTFDFFDDFNGSSLSSYWTANATSYSVSGGLLTINIGAVKLTNPLGFYLNSGYILEGKTIYYNTTTCCYSGTLTGVSTPYTSGGNANSTATVLYMREGNSTGLYTWIANGSSATYNIIAGGSVASTSNNTWYILGIKYHSGGVKLALNYTDLLTYSFSWSKNVSYITLGEFDGNSTADIHDTAYDWVRVRKYTSPEPTASFNNAPTINSVNVMPNPVKTGAGVSFNVNWSDPDSGDLVKIHICKSNAISSQTCTGGSWCDLASFSNKNPATCTYVPTNSNIGINNYYAFVCDDDNACSSVSSGTFTVESASSPQKIALSNTSSGGVITSAIFDTGVVGGAAFHSILWQGTLNNGVVKFQLACSNSKSGPWTYYGPTSTADYYQPAGPNIPVPIAKTGNASCQNKRYIRYKMFIEPSAGGTSPIVDDVIINWSP